MRVLVLLLLLLPLAHAQQGVVVEKELNSPASPPGEPVEVTLTIKNSGTLPLEGVEVRDKVDLPGFSREYSFPLSKMGPGREVTLTYTIVAQEEGNYTLAPAAVKFRKGEEVFTTKSNPARLVVSEGANQSSTAQYPQEFSNQSEVTSLYFAEKKGIGLGEMSWYVLIGLLALIPVALALLRYSRKKSGEINLKYSKKKLYPQREDALARAKKLYYGDRVKEAFEVISSETKDFLGQRYSLKESATLRDLLEKVERDPRLTSRDRDSLRGTLTTIEWVRYGDHEPSNEAFQGMIFCLSRIFREREDETALSGQN